MTWLITGGAGYIGAHLVRALHKSGGPVVVVDDFSAGVQGRLPDDVPVIDGDLLDPGTLDDVFGSYQISGVAHIAAKKKVAESVSKPLYYYEQNVEALRLLLARCVAEGVPSFLFSSSAAVYGNTGDEPVSEDTPCVPVNPYGQTKLAGEWLTHAVGAAHGINTVALRYFNVAGAAAPELAERNPANLVPLALQALQRGEAPVIYGDDYPTRDGTCIRDYVDVTDLADAHVTAIQALTEKATAGATFNIGSGRGNTVREVIDTAIEITGVNVSPVVAPRRAGDPSAVVAAVGRANNELDWWATRSLRDMIESAWAAR